MTQPGPIVGKPSRERTTAFLADVARAKLAAETVETDEPIDTAPFGVFPFRFVAERVRRRLEKQTQPVTFHLRTVREGRFRWVVRAYQNVLEP